MKFLFGSICLFLFIILAACGNGTDEPEDTATDVSSNGSSDSASADGLPELPKFVKDRGKLVVGVKADYPPFGFINEKGENDGFDIDLAKQLAEYAFGDPNAIEFVPVTASNRIPFLTSKKIDLLIATLGVTDERKEQIDFSKPYYNSSVLFLVPNESDITKMEDVKDKEVIAIKGSMGSIELEELSPSTKQLKLDNTSEGVRALKSGRGVAMIQDDILLYDIVKNNPDLKVVGEPFALGLMAVGIRKGEEDWDNWVNAAIDKGAEEDLFYEWFKKWYPEDHVNVPEYLPRPK
ncbi:transporter substrate-binding domain-containing protein [Sporosarcina sp. FSL W7-1349]|uniref:transporter substrate-binding domain-containing protein n=1 Tax=Sporosarcina sp. FSL W7-1349 TaxID=2921561 RepID=UPI0030F56231